MSKHIALSTPNMSKEGYELKFVHEAFEKNWIAPLGENVTQFESAVKTFISADNAVALSSGTAAIHLSLICAGVGSGDLVFCQDLTFAASANPITYLGAEPVFIDSERDTWNMDPVALQKAIDLYGVPKAVVVVHLYGNPAKMNEICDICDKYDISLIEDAAEALGSEYSSRKCGTFGRFGVLSFNGNKIITTSGGGMLLCKEADDAKHALKLATQAREPFPWYQHEEIGHNYRMSNVCAGIGRGQMMVLSERIAKKQEIARKYKACLEGLPVKIQPVSDNSVSNYWLTSILFDTDSSIKPMELLKILEQNDIESRPLWKPMHSQPVFANAKYVKVENESVSDDLFTRGLCLPSDTNMTIEDVEFVCDVIRAAFKG